MFYELFLVYKKLAVKSRRGSMLLYKETMSFVGPGLILTEVRRWKIITTLNGCQVNTSSYSDQINFHYPPSHCSVITADFAAIQIIFINIFLKSISNELNEIR